MQGRGWSEHLLNDELILFPGAIAGLADQPIQNIVAQQTQTDKVPTTTAAAGSIMTGVGKVGAFTK